MTEPTPRTAGPWPASPEMLAFLDALPVGAYTCDADGLITYFNAAAEKAWGRAPALNSPVDRWCGSFRLFRAGTGEPIVHDACWMALAIKNGRAYNGQEIEIERPDGTRWTALAHANPIRDEQGRLTGAVNVLVDITDRKRAEEAHQRLAVIVESSDDAIISKTVDGTIQTWNPGAERLFGYSAREAIGAPVTLIVPPERREEEAEILGRLRRGERVEHYETVRIAKDGRRLDISLSIAPIRNGDGRVVAASTVGRDVTARKRDEKALELIQEMSAKLAKTLDPQVILEEALRTAMAIAGADFGLLSLVEADSGRLRPKVSFGLSRDFLMAVDPIGPGEGACGICLSTREPVVIEDVRTDPRFEPHRAAAKGAGFRAAHSTPLFSHGGEVLGVLSLQFRRAHRPSEREIGLVDLCALQAVDFLENAKLYAELQESDRAKNRFLAILSHELRNPLAPIRNAVETLHLSAGPAAPEQAGTLQLMDRQISHLARLIDDLLDISRITANKLDLRKEPIELAEVVRAAVEASRPVLAASDHELEIQLPSEPVWLDADLTRMAQVVSNLLHNAAKYTPESGRIQLVAGREDNQAVIRVRDNGVGIPAPMLTRIFEMFTQVGEPAGQARGGLGIGLTLAQRLVDMHGGTIEAGSEGPGRGSEFTIRLPARSEPPRPLPHPAAASLSSQRTKHPQRILIVDDNRDAADSMGALLGLQGHQVQVAYDSREAIEAAARFEPQVILLDIGLPGLNGYETAQQVRQQPWGRNALLIAVTGWGQEEAKRRSWEAGFDSHLVKPVDPGVLVDLLGTLAENRKAAGR